jgi:hypothetical protein
MILSKSQLVENILTELSDNSTGQISPYDIRHNLLDIIDSVAVLLQNNELDTNNFSSPATRTTRAGHHTIENLALNGYFSIDNSAFGFSALKSNYQGSRNTAVVVIHYRAMFTEKIMLLLDITLLEGILMVLATSALEVTP